MCLDFLIPCYFNRFEASIWEMFLYLTCSKKNRIEPVVFGKFMQSANEGNEYVYYLLQVVIRYAFKVLTIR